MAKDEIEPWLRRWYDSQYKSWARKVDAEDSGAKEAADRIDRHLIKPTPKPKEAPPMT